MKIKFSFRKMFYRINISAQSLWMDFERGEGELGITNQGWSKISSFSQETEAIGQQEPWNGDRRPKLGYTPRVSSAGCTGFSDSTPQFFFKLTGDTQSELQELRQLRSQLLEANTEYGNR